MKDKTCKCTHLKSEHKKGLCNNCPCSIFTNSIRKPKLDNLFMAIGLAGAILFIVGMPIMFLIDIMNMPEDLKYQIIITHDGIENTIDDITYLELSIAINVLASFISIGMGMFYLWIFTDSRRMIKRKDYNV